MRLEMFVKSIRHVARSTPTAPAPTCLILRTSTAPITASRRRQRRQSSSKTSSAPGGSRGAEQAASSTSNVSPEGERRPTGRMTRRKSKDATSELALKAKGDTFVNLPSVPATNHLNPQDVAISTFFSLHRPISVTTPLPTSTSISSFNAIFDPPKPAKPIDVIFTLSNAVSILESGGAQPSGSSNNKGDKDLRWEILQQSTSNSDPSKRSIANLSPEQYAQQIQRLMHMFRPFNVPPEPQPFPDNQTGKFDEGVIVVYVGHKEDGSVRRRSRLRSQTKEAETETAERQNIQLAQQEQGPEHLQTRLNSRQRRRRIAISVQKKLGGTSIVNRRAKSDAVPTSQQSERERGNSESLTPRGVHRALSERSIYLISVKRQRKLKMKKHKYKKLMRRTRNLRKREGRL